MSHFLKSLTKVFTVLGLGMTGVAGASALQARQRDIYLAERLAANSGPHQSDIARSYQHQRADNRVDMTASTAFTLLGAAIVVLGVAALKQQGRNGPGVN